MKKTLAIGLLALAPIGWAQEFVRKVIPIKYADMRQVKDLVSVFGANCVQIGDSIAVNGHSDAVDAIEAALKKIDVPPPVAPDVELTVYLVGASSGPTSQAQEPLPAGLEPVMKQLHGVFAYRDYRVMESFVMRVRPGTRGSNSGTIADKDFYSFGFRSLTLTEESGHHTIHVDGLGLTLEFATDHAKSMIGADIDIGEGQKVVVGKTSLPNSAVILVLSARVVD